MARTLSHPALHVRAALHCAPPGSGHTGGAAAPRSGAREESRRGVAKLQFLSASRSSNTEGLYEFPIRVAWHLFDRSYFSSFPPQCVGCVGSRYLFPSQSYRNPRTVWMALLSVM